MKAGITIVLCCYVVGVALTMMAYYSFDNSYAHAPSPYMLVAFLFFVVGVIWTTIATLAYFFNKNERRKVIILTHLCVLFAIVLLVRLSIM